MMSDTQQRALAEMDGRYDADVSLVWRFAKTPGYHTKIADGTKVHETRESADYAVACLRSDDAQRVARGERVLERLLSLQESDPLAPSFGIWSWFYEEPVSKMCPPDWNWADFIGSRLLMVLCESSQKMGELLRQRLEQAIERAAMSIFRRQVVVGYTNIAIMGAGVCAAAGERLGRPILLEYGRNKLRAVVTLAREVGCFNEYNSPTYTMVAIEECERILHLVRDPATRALASDLHTMAWKMVAEHWHQPTGQWAGPHARAYSDLLGATTLQRIGKAVGIELPSARAEEVPVLHLVPELPCPRELVSHFTAPLETPRMVAMPLGGKVEGVDRVATTWLAPTCCLAAVNREHTWAQRRNLLAYWRRGGGVAVFKMQWLLDGRDMPGMRLAASHVQNRVLMALYPLYGCGAFHPNFEAPVDHVHSLGDLRLRFQVEGEGAAGREILPGVFELGCGDHAVRINVADCMFDGRAVQWEVKQEGSRAMLDGVCVNVPGKVNFKELRVRLAAGMQILRPGGHPTTGAVMVQETGSQQRIEWAGSGLESLEIPVNAQPFSW